MQTDTRPARAARSREDHAYYADLRTGGVLRRWLGLDWISRQPQIEQILFTTVLVIIPFSVVAYIAALLLGPR